MTGVTGKLAGRGKAAMRAAVDAAETRILVAEGRRSVRKKVRTVKQVTRKAAKAGLVAGALAAAGVVVREVRKRRRD